tara:strand:- start:10328 stop:10696 length:369 start_codon:yes stop_codon:yes gene_type:complete
MPPKKEPVPAGEMTMAELKRLMKKYNDLMGFDVAGKTRSEIIKFITSQGYTIDHAGKSISRPKQKVKKMPMKVDTPAKPEKKDKAEKKEKTKLKKEDVIQFILKNTEVLKDKRVMKLHKGLV